MFKGKLSNRSPHLLPPSVDASKWTPPKLCFGGESFLQWGMAHMMGIYPLKEQTTERTSLTLSFIRIITNADMYHELSPSSNFIRVKPVHEPIPTNPG